MRFLALFAAVSFLFNTAFAQLPYSDSNIRGTWQYCGSVRSQTYYQPPAFINTDSLKKNISRLQRPLG